MQAEVVVCGLLVQEKKNKNWEIETIYSFFLFLFFVSLSQMGNWFSSSCSVFHKDGKHSHYLLAFVEEGVYEAEKTVSVFHYAGNEVECQSVKFNELQNRIIYHEDKGQGHRWFLDSKDIFAAAKKAMEQNPNHCCRVWVNETLELLRKEETRLSGEGNAKLWQESKNRIYLVGIATNSESFVFSQGDC